MSSRNVKVILSARSAQPSITTAYSNVKEILVELGSNCMFIGLPMLQDFINVTHGYTVVNYTVVGNPPDDIIRIFTTICRVPPDIVDHRVDIPDRFDLNVLLNMLNYPTIEQETEPPSRYLANAANSGNVSNSATVANSGILTHLASMAIPANLQTGQLQTSQVANSTNLQTGQLQSGQLANTTNLQTGQLQSGQLANSTNVSNSDNQIDHEQIRQVAIVVKNKITESRMCVPDMNLINQSSYRKLNNFIHNITRTRLSNRELNIFVEEYKRI